MCGIIGHISSKGTIGNSSIKAITQMIVCDSLRGEDSTGIVFGNRQGKVGYYKDTVPGYDIVSDRRLLKKVNAYNNSFIFAHNRYATMGGSWDVDGAHPFEHGDIIMVHNGTLDNHRTLPDGNKFTVDSEAICFNLAHNGVETTIKNLEGAFALVWVNTRENRLYMVRNEDRPLHLFFTSEGLFFCSEAKMGEWILDRNNIKVNSDAALPIGELLSFDLSQTNLTSRRRTVELAEKKILGGRGSSWNKDTRRYNYQTGKWKETHHSGSGNSSSTTSNLPAKTEGEGDVNGNVLQGEFQQNSSKTLQECAICMDRLPASLMSEVTANFVGQTEYICETCDENYFNSDGKPMKENENWIDYELVRGVH